MLLCFALLFVTSFINVMFADGNNAQTQNKQAGSGQESYYVSADKNGMYLGIGYGYSYLSDAITTRGYANKGEHFDASVGYDVIDVMKLELTAASDQFYNGDHPKEAGDAVGRNATEAERSRRLDVTSLGVTVKFVPTKSYFVRPFFALGSGAYLVKAEQKGGKRNSGVAYGFSGSTGVDFVFSQFFYVGVKMNYNWFQPNVDIDFDGKSEKFNYGLSSIGAGIGLVF